jgi:integrase
MEEGRIKVAQLAAGRIEAADMSRSDRDDLIAARELCGSVPLLSALEEWKKARGLAEGNLIAAAEAWASRNGTSYEDVSIELAVDQFISAKSRAGVDVSASYEKIFPSLKRALGERSMASVSSRELSAWMDERYPHPVTRNTARKRIVTLWRWCRKQGYLPREALTEAEQTDSVREEDATIGVINGKTYSALLGFFQKKHPEYLGALVIAGFCGLRRSEIHEQVWEDVFLDRKFVRVTAAKRNTPARRLVPLVPAAIKWLKLCPERKEELCANLAVDRLRSIARDEGFTLPENCFRHSFISHRIAQTGNVAETALESGNSPQIIFRHYRELFSKAEGEAWFRIRPRGDAPKPGDGVAAD